MSREKQNQAVQSPRKLRALESYGMEARRLIGDDTPCILVIEASEFGNYDLMKKVTKKAKMEYKHHPCKFVVPMTTTITKYGTGFVSGLTSVEGKDMTLGIYAAFHGYDMRQISIIAVPIEQKKQFLKFKSRLMDAATRKLPRLKKDTAWVIGSGDNTLINLKVDINRVVNERKQEIIDTIENFFANPQPYIELGLPPFRKICFAGKPGTGKTLTAAALAKLMKDKHDIKTMYVSSGSQWGSNFELIKAALNLLKGVKAPTLMIVEEFDSFVNNPDDRAKILNFLDGFETPNLEYPLCLLVTTNHPEKIDPAILDRSGRINRIFWFEGISNIKEANEIVDMYKGALDLPEIGKLVQKRTPDFIKELMIELRWQKANGLQMTVDNISQVIDSVGGNKNRDEDRREIL